MSSFVQDICQLLIHLLSATHLKEGFLTGIHFIIKKVFYLILGEFLFRIFSFNFTISGMKSFFFIFPRQISNILYLTPLIFSKKKIAHFSMRLHWINLYISNHLVLSFGTICFLLLFFLFIPSLAPIFFYNLKNVALSVCIYFCTVEKYWRIFFRGFCKIHFEDKFFILWASIYLSWGHVRGALETPFHRNASKITFF